MKYNKYFLGETRMNSRIIELRRLCTNLTNKLYYPNKGQVALLSEMAILLQNTMFVLLNDPSAGFSFHANTNVAMTRVKISTLCIYTTTVLGLYSLRRRRLISIRIPIINPRRSSDRLRFIMGIPIPVRQRRLRE